MPLDAQNLRKESREGNWGKEECSPGSGDGGDLDPLGKLNGRPRRNNSQDPEGAETGNQQSGQNWPSPFIIFLSLLLPSWGVKK